jgi:hypothetical protein
MTAASFAIAKPAIPGIGDVCPNCWNSGLVFSPSKTIQVCPRIQMNPKAHPINSASRFIQKASTFLNDRVIALNELQFDLARILCNFTSSRPIKCRELEQYFLGFTALDAEAKRRKILAMVSDLKGKWNLPVGSSRSAPEGFWMISTLEEFKEQVKRDSSQPITSLTTIHSVARRCFPEFAEQMQLDFFENVEKAECTI